MKNRQTRKRCLPQIFYLITYKSLELFHTKSVRFFQAPLQHPPAVIISNPTTVSASNEQTAVEDTGEQQPSLRQEIPKLKKGNWVNQTA